LKKLKLYKNKLLKLPDSIGYLPNLEYINFYSNRIEVVPYSFGNLSNLTSFGFNTNPIKVLPSSLNNLYNLTTSHNGIDWTTREINETPLEFLKRNISN
jgi:Leucine-rich repeat (LRR) protein